MGSQSQQKTLKVRTLRERWLCDQSYSNGYTVGRRAMTEEMRNHIRAEEKAVLAEAQKQIAADRKRLDGVPQLARALYELCNAAGVPTISQGRL